VDVAKAVMDGSNTNIGEFAAWAKGVVGMTEFEVTEAINAAGGSVHIVSRDDVVQPPPENTEANVLNRANLVIEKGLVTRVVFG